LPPDFFNSREDALLICGLAILAFVVYKDPRGIGSAFLNVLRAFVQPKLLILYGVTLAYSALVVYAAAALDLWHTTAVKATIYWFLGSGVVLVGEAVSRISPRDPAVWRRVLRRVIAITLAIEFIVNVYALPLLVELVLAVIALLCVGIRAAIKHDRSADPRVGTMADVGLAAVGFVYLGSFVVRVLGDLDGFLARETAEDFLVGPALTIALIPLLYAFAAVSRWEQARLRRRSL
jgi:hypothetical protein